MGPNRLRTCDVDLTKKKKNQSYGDSMIVKYKQKHGGGMLKLQAGYCVQT